MYENVTYEILLQRMLDRVSSKMDKREGSVIWDTHSPTAIELQILYIELDNLLRDAYGDTATRDYLILRCRERGITPEPTTNAILKGEFTPENVDVIGKRFNIGELNYVVLAKNPDGGYQVQCETPGAIGNRYLGQLIPIEYVDGLVTAELTEILIPGEDEEETEHLRQRYFDSFDEQAFGGNVQDYLKKTNSIPGVGGTKVTRVWNSDIRPADMIPGDAVKAWYGETVEGLQDEVKSWLQTVYTAALNKKLTVGGTVLITIVDSEFGAASGALIQSVQTALDPEVNAGEGMGLAPIGHVVTVKSATAVPVNVKTEITFDSGYSWDNLQSAIDTAISDYLLEQRKTWPTAPYIIVRISQIETRILGIQGIVDIRGTSINGVEDNLTLGPFEIPTFGGASDGSGS